jgi:hypothetical protein
MGNSMWVTKSELAAWNWEQHAPSGPCPSQAFAARLSGWLSSTGVSPRTTQFLGRFFGRLFARSWVASSPQMGKVWFGYPLVTMLRRCCQAIDPALQGVLTTAKAPKQCRDKRVGQETCPKRIMAILVVSAEESSPLQNRRLAEPSGL